MLGLQLLKAHGSSTAFYEAMTTNFNDLCGDFECLHPLNTKLLQSKVNRGGIKHFRIIFVIIIIVIGTLTVCSKKLILLLQKDSESFHLA